MIDIFGESFAIFSGGSDLATTKSLVGPSGNTRDRASSVQSSRLRREMQNGCVERSAASNRRVHQDMWPRGDVGNGHEGLQRGQSNQSQREDLRLVDVIVSIIAIRLG